MNAIPAIPTRGIVPWDARRVGQASDQLLRFQSQGFLKLFNKYFCAERVLQLREQSSALMPIFVTKPSLQEKLYLVPGLCFSSDSGVQVWGFSQVGGMGRAPLARRKHLRVPHLVCWVCVKSSSPSAARLSPAYGAAAGRSRAIGSGIWGWFDPGVLLMS